MTDEELLGELEDLLRNVPSRATVRHETEENWGWFGRVASVIDIWNPIKSAAFESAKSKLLGGRRFGATGAEFNQIMMLLHHARHQLRLRTVGPVSSAIGSGQIFDYFDELRKIIEAASTDVFFVDPYLDADFVSRYLPHVKGGVSIRLLADRKLATLLPAVETFAIQSKAGIEVRSATGFHDRYLLTDRMACYQSGASFKDGGRNAPTTLTQITDAFAAVQQTYESIWSSGTVVYPNP